MVPATTRGRRAAGAYLVLVVVVAVVVGAVLSRGRHVRLETHVAPPSVRLHVDALPVAAGTGRR